MAPSPAQELPVSQLCWRNMSQTVGLSVAIGLCAMVQSTRSRPPSGLADDLLAEIGMAAGVGPQAGQVLVRCRAGRARSRIAPLGRNAQRQLGLGWIVLKGVDVLPGSLIVADDGRRILGNCALVGLR